MIRVTSWDEANWVLRNARTGKLVPTRKVANNTYLVRRMSGAIVVRLHDTDVVTYHGHHGSSITLNSGGWLTATTRERMNYYTPSGIEVFPRRGRWYVTTALMPVRSDLGSRMIPHRPTAHPFGDGIRLTHDPDDRFTWNITGGPDPEQVAREDAHNARIERMITATLRSKHFTELCSMEAFEYLTFTTEQHAGNCPFCIIIRNQRIVGDAMGDTQHLIDHLIDRRLNFGLVLAAMGGQALSQRLMPPYDRRECARAVRRFLRERLYIGAVTPAHGRNAKLIAA